MIFVRNFLFWILASLATMVTGLTLCCLIPFPDAARFFVLKLWRNFCAALARCLVGLKTEVRGRENIPASPTLVLAKHESAWETVGLQNLFIPAVFVLKKELLKIPFFGWGLFALRMIAIDRSAGRKALQQLLEQGKERLKSGIWIIVFPEGTRVAPGEKMRYKSGAAYLALKTGLPVVPVAHNAADYWPKKSFLIRPGTITVSIGPAIPTVGKNDAEINAAVETWIENEMRVIAPRRYQAEVKPPL
ncbi:MAG: 1-acyl-sn-glycerol-3-phosphate acyltransferase [Betaproteobacteria bacterium]|nr:1-acyl-sn-glycerol-3-phosphate acyltransferase [Betaproteobacteria bacterium]